MVKKFIDWIKSFLQGVLGEQMTMKDNMHIVFNGDTNEE